MCIVLHGLSDPLTPQPAHAREGGRRISSGPRCLCYRQPYRAYRLGKPRNRSPRPRSDPVGRPSPPSRMPGRRPIRRGPSEGSAGLRSRRSSSIRARIAAKSSAARGRVTFPPAAYEWVQVSGERRCYGMTMIRMGHAAPSTALHAWPLYPHIPALALCRCCLALELGLPRFVDAGHASSRWAVGSSADRSAAASPVGR